MKIKLLFLSNNFYPDVGGIEVISEMLAKAFTEHNYEVRLLTWTIGEDIEKSPFLIIRKPSIKTILEQHIWADIIFENNPCLRMSWPGLFVYRSSVVVLHTWLSRANGKISWQDRLKLMWLKRATRVIAVSKALRERCFPAAVVIENPYNNNKFKILRNFQERAGFVFLGRLVSDKGADIAIRAFHKLLEIDEIQDILYKNKLLTIIGNGPEMTKLVNLVNELNLNEYVTFTGTLLNDELVYSLNCHQFILVPSRWEEPFGIVALEGMACGCLPIVSDGGGLPDAVGNAGLTFERGNVNSLTECIRNVLQNPHLEESIRVAASTHLSFHDNNIVVNNYLEVLKNTF